MDKKAAKDWDEAHRSGVSAKEAADAAWSKKPKANVNGAHKSNGRHTASGVDDTKQQGQLLSSAAFVAGFVAPDYLIDRVIQRKYLYSLTGPTGSGKTAIALLLSALIAGGRDLGDHAVEQGRVLIFAGENPDDIRARWMARAERMEFDVSEIDVYFIAGKFSINDLMGRIKQEARQLGGFDLIVVDTSAVYFEGDDENSNVQIGDHARKLRELTTMEGGPCIIVNCHPVKNASADNMIPRGGGAFLNEVDGNLVCLGNRPLVDLWWHGKLRGPGFEPIPFELVTVTCDKVKDSKGRHVSTVVARHLSETEEKDIAKASRTDQDDALLAMLQHEGASVAAIAEACGWMTTTGKPHKSKVARVLPLLKADRLIAKARGGAWGLTEAGKKEAAKIQTNRKLAGAKYG
jgi:hypothetical protein